MQQVTLKESIGGMALLPQFFVWRLTWDAAEGKYQKYPCYLDGREYPMSAKESSNWMTFDDAMGHVLRMRAADTTRQYTLGFFLTSNTGYWFLDVDKCINAERQFTPVAQWLYNALPGASFEYSSSGTGFHIFGRGQLPPHKTKPLNTGLELYDNDRGIAFGLSGFAYGSADTDHAGVMWHHVVPAYFAPDITDASGHSGTGPRDDWRGPTDDDELIARALRSQPVASMFNDTKAKFADLFQGNMDVLHKAYQDSDGSFAESEADMALAAHFAFWTGCDAERMERLMLKSALRRDKWFSHATYLRKLTIGNACLKQTNVCKDKPLEQLAVVTSEVPQPAIGSAVEGNTFLNADAQREIFKGCVYVVDEGKIFVPMPGGGFQFMGSDQFSAWFGNYTFVKDKENTQVAKSAYEAFTRSTLVRFDRVQHTMFSPNIEPGSVFVLDGVTYVNTYMPLPVRRVAGDPAPFLNHVAKMLPNVRDQQILLSYMAACVQHRGTKFTWCPVIQGLPGNGKSLLAKCVIAALGQKFSHSPVAQELGNNFNDWLDEKLFIPVNDMIMPRGKDEVLETIKPMITEDTLQIEGKGIKKRMRNICANFFMSMNKRDGVRKEIGDRRFAIFFTAQQIPGDLERTGMGQEYWLDLLAWFRADGYAIVADWLHTWPIPVELNPATTLTRAPDTSSEAEVTTEARGTIEEAVIAAIEEGRPGFMGGWLCWQRVKSLVEELRYRSMPNARLEELINKLGYLPHPRLGAKGLTNNRVWCEDNRQVRIYCLPNHSSVIAELTHGDVVKQYQADQQLSGGGGNSGINEGDTAISGNYCPPPPQFLN